MAPGVLLAWALPVLVALSSPFSWPPSPRSPAHAAPKCYHLTASDKNISKEETTTFNKIFVTILGPPSPNSPLNKKHYTKNSLQSFLQFLNRENSVPMWCWY